MGENTTMTITTDKPFDDLELFNYFRRTSYCIFFNYF